MSSLNRTCVRTEPKIPMISPNPRPKKHFPSEKECRSRCIGLVPCCVSRGGLLIRRSSGEEVCFKMRDRQVVDVASKVNS